MALNRNIQPGTIVTVNGTRGKTAGIACGSQTLESLTLWSTPGLSIVGSAHKGDWLTIVEGPRKINGINVCHVMTTKGVEGLVYWTELRSNCRI